MTNRHRFAGIGILASLLCTGLAQPLAAGTCFLPISGKAGTITQPLAVTPDR